jgi:hypothetical protein
MAYKLAGVVAVFYGLAAIAGGAVGAHLIEIPGLPLEAENPSMVSFYAGGGSGLVLIFLGISLLRCSRIAAWGAILVSLIVMAARPVPGLISHLNDLAAFLSTTKGKVGATMIIGGLLTVLFAALVLRQSKPTQVQG